MNNIGQLISEVSRAAGGSGIRKIALKAEKLSSPINLSVGQPDFDVPSEVREAIVIAISDRKNGYVPSGGIQPLVNALKQQFLLQYPHWKFDSGECNVMVASGVTTAIFFALMTIINPGDEIIIGDPEFLHYAEIVTQLGGIPIRISTYPDFSLTINRIEPAITRKTKAIIFSSPGNPTGKVISREECFNLVALAEKYNILLISDEIYRDFYYRDGSCPSIAEFSTGHTLVLRGLSKSHGMTGWRVGFAFGPAEIIECMSRLQGLCIVSAPSITQHAGLAALSVKTPEIIKEYSLRCHMIRDELDESYKTNSVEAGFFYFIKVPESLRLNATQFCEAALEYNLVIIPGNVFSSQDTHFRLSLTASREKLSLGVQVLNRMIQ